MKLTHPLVITGAVVVVGAGLIAWNESRRADDAKVLAAMPEEQRVEVKAERALPKKATAPELSTLRSMRERWATSTELAGSTSRMSLPPVILRLQDLRAEAAGLDLGTCLEAVRAPVLEVMDMEIQSHIEFLSSASSMAAEIELREKMIERSRRSEDLTARIDMQTRICSPN